MDVQYQQARDKGLVVFNACVDEEKVLNGHGVSNEKCALANVVAIHPNLCQIYKFAHTE